MKHLDKLRKFAEGGKVRKYAGGDAFESLDDDVFLDFADLQGIRYNLSEKEQANYNAWKLADDKVAEERLKLLNRKKQKGETWDEFRASKQSLRSDLHKAQDDRAAVSGKQGIIKGRLNASAEAFEDTMSTSQAKMGVAAGIEAANFLDSSLIGDKNFGAQSQAIDDSVHGVSGALLQTGNPYCVAAAAALEGANFLTKAGGQTVQGFDVDINSSGYGDIGHMESSSSRDFGAMIGLGGLNQKSMQRKLAKRNQQAQMAMNAANIANEQSFEQEARANSIQNTITNNQIALAGGLDTSLLGG